MTQVSRRPRGRRPLSPKQAAACCWPIDGLLDPELFKGLCDPTRAKLLGCLIKCGRACSVSEVAECCAVDFSVVSRHLQLLERAGVLESVKLGRTVFYAVKFVHLCRTLRGLADAIEECCPAGGACAGGCCGKG
jgi:ArsR family transcriptional regulator, arsenate/arsenite/antimonite-responsive transcriptional repressor